jgi:hypothetical protein
LRQSGVETAELLRSASFAPPRSSGRGGSKIPDVREVAVLIGRQILVNGEVAVLMNEDDILID